METKYIEVKNGKEIIRMHVLEEFFQICPIPEAMDYKMLYKYYNILQWLHCLDGPAFHRDFMDAKIYYINKCAYFTKHQWEKDAELIKRLITGHLKAPPDAFAGD